MVAGSNCCDPLAFHFFRGRKEGLFEGRRRVDFLRDDPDDGLAMFRMMRGTTRPIIVDWNQDGHQDILMAYKGNRDFYILYGSPDIAKSILNLPVVEDHVESESYYSEKGSTDWKPEFSKLEIPALAALKPKTGKGGPIRKKLGVLIGSNRIIVEQPSVDWVEVADWDNDGDLDLLVNMRRHRWSYPKSGLHIGHGRTRYRECPPHMWSLHWLSNDGLPGKPEFGSPQPLFAAPESKQIGPFTVSDLDDSGEPRIVAAIGDLKDNSKTWSTRYRFVVLGR